MAMEIVACILCGRLFETYDKKICPLCAKKEDEYYKQVKALIKEKPGISFKMIIEETGVPERLMRRWLQEGRIEIANSEGVGLRCERCNKEILQGKYCVDCRQVMQNGLNEIMKEERKIMNEAKNSEKKGQGMHYFDK
jgi:RNA polymerase subunit RPABC4/transcription elongation factor Spt4